MSDPIDQNNPPSTPPPALPDPQALVDAALSPTPAATPATPTTPTEPSMPTVPPMPEPVAPVTPPPAPEPTPAPPVANVAMGDDTPLAFVTPPPSSSAPSIEPKPPVDGAVPLPPVPPAPTESVVPKKKAGLKKTVGVILGVLALFVVLGFGGLYAYMRLGIGEPVKIAGVQIGVKGPVQDIDNPGDCSGASNGGWLVWRNGACKVTGISDSTVDKNNDGVGDKNTVNPNLATKNNDSGCIAAGGDWCSGTDAKGQSYSFCATREANKACYQYAIDRGYTIQIGDFNGECILSEGGDWVLSDKSEGQLDDYNDPKYQVDGKSPLQRAQDQCTTAHTLNYFGNAKYICKVGVVGDGGDVYTGGACTEDNGKPYTGDGKGCFCGTVQIDTGSGHTSYTNTCGCDKTPKESNPPTITTNSTMACTGLTQAPAAPKVGDKVTFTCTGTITPTTAGTLSYKFRYSINNATPSAMVNKTATTTELNVAACGEYKVECQTCATIAGVLKCDPNWVGATQ